MKKRYRKVRTIWLVLIGLCGLLSGLYGCLVWGTLAAKVAILIAMGLFTVGTWLCCQKWEVK